MRKQLQSAFGLITAEPELVDNTKQAVAARMQKGRRKSPAQILAYAACAVAAVVVLAFGGTAYYTNTAYISVDVNPSLELELNRFDKVLEARPLNQEAEDLLKELDVRGQHYEQALDSILEKERNEGYITQESAVLVAVQSADQGQQQKMLEGALRSTKTHVTGAKARCIPVDEGTREEAKNHGVTAGKYSAIKELQKIDPTVTIEDYKTSSMRAIMDKAEQKEAEQKAVQATASPTKRPAIVTAAPATQRPTAQPPAATAKASATPVKAEGQSTEKPTAAHKENAASAANETSNQAVSGDQVHGVPDDLDESNAQATPDAGDNSGIPAQPDDGGINPDSEDGCTGDAEESGTDAVCEDEKEEAGADDMCEDEEENDAADGDPQENGNSDIKGEDDSTNAEGGLGGGDGAANQPDGSLGQYDQPNGPEWEKPFSGDEGAFLEGGLQVKSCTNGRVAQNSEWVEAQAQSGASTPKTTLHN